MPSPALCAAGGVPTNVAAIVVGISCAELDFGVTIPMPVQVAEKASLHKIVAAALADMAAAVGTGAVLEYDQAADPFERLERMRDLRHGSGRCTRIKQVPIYMLCPSCRSKCQQPSTAALSSTQPPVVTCAEVSTQTRPPVVMEATDEEDAITFLRRAGSTPPTPSPMSIKAALTGVRSSSKGGRLGVMPLASPSGCQSGKLQTPTPSPVWRVSTGRKGSGTFGTPSPMSASSIANLGNGISPNSRGRQLAASLDKVDTCGSSRVGTRSFASSGGDCAPDGNSDHLASRATTISSALLGADSSRNDTASDSTSGSEVEGGLEIDIASVASPSGEMLSSGRQRSGKRSSTAPAVSSALDSTLRLSEVGSTSASTLEEAAGEDLLSILRSVAEEGSSEASTAHPNHTRNSADRKSPERKASSPQVPAASCSAMDKGGKSRSSGSEDRPRMDASRQQRRASTGDMSGSVPARRRPRGITSRSLSGGLDTSCTSNEPTPRLEGGQVPIQIERRASLSQLNFSPDFPEMASSMLFRNSGSLQRFSRRSGSCPNVGSSLCRPVAGFGVETLRLERERNESLCRGNFSGSATMGAGAPPRLPSSSASPSQSPAPASDREPVRGMGIRRWLDKAGADL